MHTLLAYDQIRISTFSEIAYSQVWGGGGGGGGGKFNICGLDHSGSETFIYNMGGESQVPFAQLIGRLL